MKVLNLYAGIGGNRKLWEDVEVTAVELDPDIAKIYQDFFPDDKVIVGDAHQYLLDHYKEFDFIWASPPCPSHSRARKAGHGNTIPLYPDMKLYEEIIFLQNYYTGKWIVENVDPYYKPLIPAVKVGRHLHWANFKVGLFNGYKVENFEDANVADLQEAHGVSLDSYKGTTPKNKVLRNMVNSDLGLYILNCARNIITKQNEKQIDLF